MKKRRRLLSCLMAAALAVTSVEPISAVAARDFGWEEENGNWYWYENGVKQGTEGRGKEIYDPDSNAWYWLDSVDGGKKATGKDLYQESDAGAWAEDQETGTWKWVRYDENGHMVKEWYTNENGLYYFDPVYGTMAKGYTVIDGQLYYFDEQFGTGAACSYDGINGWVVIDGNRYRYENGVRQGLEGRGKEIYDPKSDAWYWLDSIDDGKMAVSKDVYQESAAGDWAEGENGTGKWVRYDRAGHMIKGWSKDENGTYYFDLIYGTMAKGTVEIDGKWYQFDQEVGGMVGECEQPTPAPTTEPTAAPTTEPTAAPTTEPTATPTPNPLATVEEGETVTDSGEWKGLTWKVTDTGKLIVIGSLTEQGVLGGGTLEQIFLLYQECIYGL